MPANCHTPPGTNRARLLANQMRAASRHVNA